MVKKVLQVLILLFGLFTAVAGFSYYMITIGDSAVPDMTGDMMVIQTFLFISTFSLVVGMYLVKNFIVRIITAVVFLAVDGIYIDVLRTNLPGYEDNSIDLAYVQLQYSFVLHCSLILGWVLFLIFQQWWRTRKR
ncbi:hypothetical protein [Salibacterium aidingense]|uniref:hypothetical protein n=1 Tax=Salibacterium aidingense TaxID=384933 RepID=UPI00047A7426|nr:hypothetical protein [Salibacterium aidingense]